MMEAAVSTTGSDERIKYESYWWEAAPRPDLPVPTLPARAEVAVVGSGYAGLACALRLARGGRDVWVFDAEAAGWGASSRNQGQIGAIFKRSFKQLDDGYGRAKTLAIYREGQRGVAFVKELIRSEGIECQLEENGRLVLAYTPEDYDDLARELEVLRREIDFSADMVSRAEQRREIGSDFYYGAQVRHADAAIHGGLFHQGLLDRAMAAGATIAPHTPVTAIRRESKGFEIETPRGRVAADEVVIATNGYTGRATPALRRRLLPMGAYTIATEPLDPETVRRINPNRRVCSDTRKLLFGIRTAPAEPRLVMGGRASLIETDVRKTVPILRRTMTEVFPELEGVGISHAWTGFLAFTFRHLPSIGTWDGMHYALGCSGTGVAANTWLGDRVAARILGADDTATAFDDIPFDTRPFYTGYPWFLGPAVWWYRHKDRTAHRPAA
jgi:glycine/D-amino acid oxidase-like deaminating enzyme